MRHRATAVSKELEGFAGAAILQLPGAPAHCAFDGLYILVGSSETSEQLLISSHAVSNEVKEGGTKQ